MWRSISLVVAISKVEDAIFKRKLMAVIMWLAKTVLKNLRNFVVILVYSSLASGVVDVQSAHVANALLRSLVRNIVIRRKVHLFLMKVHWGHWSESVILLAVENRARLILFQTPVKLSDLLRLPLRFLDEILA